MCSGPSVHILPLVISCWFRKVGVTCSRRVSASWGHVRDSVIDNFIGESDWDEGARKKGTGGMKGLKGTERANEER